MTLVPLNEIADGIAASPSLCFQNEPSTGFFRKAAGKMGISVLGAEVGELSGNGLAGGVHVAKVRFQAQGAVTQTGSIPIPAGATIIDVQVQGIVLWTAGTSAGLEVGNDSDPNCWYTVTDLKANDLLAGESLCFEHPGGLAGVAFAAEQRVFNIPAANHVIGVVTQVGVSNTGTTDLVVIYAVPVSIDPVIT